MQEQEVEGSDLIKPRLNYIQVFCIEFYGLLADGMPVNEAFTKAREDMKVKDAQIWECQLHKASDRALNIEPVLLQDPVCLNSNIDFE